MRKRYQIFISSTYRDLIIEREAVIKAVLKLYHLPIGMEMFHADNEEQWIQIKNTICMSDYYILIMGRYCGTLIEDEGISYTEKEYDFALSQNIPVLSFVISENAKKESYGIETIKQQKAYKKFKKKVLKLPCDFWNTPDELAFKVTSALSMKFSENNRYGWIPYDPIRIISSDKMDPWLSGNYNVFYYSALKSQGKRLIKSKLVIDTSGSVTFYNNLLENKSEYSYHGVCINEENTLYIYLKNDYSSERAVMHLIKPVGNLQRLMGLFTALSSNSVPVCVKICCFHESINLEQLNSNFLGKVLCTANTIWNDGILIVEEEQKHLFFSDEIKRG